MSEWKLESFAVDRQSMNSHHLLKKNVAFHYSKVRALKQYFKCYPAVQDHENL